MAWEVRPAVPTDAPVISGLLGQLGYRVPVAHIDLRISAGDVSALVAEDEARVVGVLGYSTRRHLHRDALVTSIDSLVVDAAFRSLGVGAALVNAVCERARGLGVGMVDLHSHISRTGARRFYERQGFEVTGNHFVRHL